MEAEEVLSEAEGYKLHLSSRSRPGGDAISVCNEVTW